LSWTVSAAVRRLTGVLLDDIIDIVTYPWHSVSMRHTQIEAITTQRVLYTAAEVATMTGLSRGFIYGAMQRGELPTVRLGRAVRVRAEALTRWIEAGANA
jgi:excisionase family DNA binding protein